MAKIKSIGINYNGEKIAPVRIAYVKPIRGGINTPAMNLVTTGKCARIIDYVDLTVIIFWHAYVPPYPVLKFKRR